MIPQLLWLFLSYAFIGWIVEIIYHALAFRRFINRGMLAGPWCPIYGFGVLLILFLVKPFAHNLLLLFLSALVICSVLELIAGYILAHVFHLKWWDYSEFPLNFKGYICLRFSVLWGLGGVVVVRLIHPVLSGIAWHIPLAVSSVLLTFLYGVFLMDFLTTLLALGKIRNQLTLAAQIQDRIRVVSDGIGGNIAAGVEKTAKLTEATQPKLDELKARAVRLYGQAERTRKRLNQAFPRLGLERRFMEFYERLMRDPVWRDFIEKMRLDVRLRDWQDKRKEKQKHAPEDETET